MASSALTDTQKMLAKTLDIASQSVIAYSAPEVPPLGNATPEGLLEEFGRLNEARKALEKVEKILKVRLESQLAGRKELRGDNFNYKKAVQERTALDQTMAKAKLEELGILPGYMKTTEVETTTVKRN
jgi:hypothetical protein